MPALELVLPRSRRMGLIVTYIMARRLRRRQTLSASFRRILRLQQLRLPPSRRVFQPVPQADKVFYCQRFSFKRIGPSLKALRELDNQMGGADEETEVSGDICDEY